MKRSVAVRESQDKNGNEEYVKHCPAAFWHDIALSPHRPILLELKALREFPVCRGSVNGPEFGSRLEEFNPHLGEASAIGA